MQVIKNIYCKKDCTIATKIETVKMVKGDVKLVRFINETEYETLLPLGLFIACVSPPKEIQGNRSTPDKPEEPKITQPPLKEPEKIEDDENPKLNKSSEDDAPTNCPKCDGMMILTTNQKTHEEVYYCPNCPLEVPVKKPESEEPVVDETPKEKSKPVYSKCGCGKRKSASAEKCKSCTAKDKVNQSQVDSQE